MPATRAEFEAVFPQLVADVQSVCRGTGLPENALKWYKDNLEANTLGGKYNRGLSVIDTAQLLLQRPLEPKEAQDVATLGWMVELLQAFFLVADDMMDSSKTRRGQPCWYLRPQVGMIAINDSFMLEAAIYVLLKKHFRSHPRYVEFLELFLETTFQTELGQSIDLLTAPEDHVNLDNFSLEKFYFIVRYKTAFYSFYLPVALAVTYLNLSTEKNLQQAKDILVPMGEYFQAQDDYLDAFADPTVLGKIGTDIQDNKCSWLVNQALARVTPEQRKLLEDNYGQKNAECEARVKKLYNELQLQQVYATYEEKVVGEINQKIEQVDETEGLKKSVFNEFLRKIYKRSK